MAQHDFVLDNASGQNVRIDMTAAVQALASSSLGTVEPATPYAGQLWLDSSGGGNGALKIRDLANMAWKVLFPSVDAAGSGAGVPTGTILDFAGATAPTGFLLCHGQIVPRADYPTLFAVLGATYGAGDGSTTFQLPDLRGRFVAGKDDMGGTTAGRLTGITGSVNGDLLGAVGGEEGIALTINEMPAHNHTATTTTSTSTTMANAANLVILTSTIGVNAGSTYSVRVSGAVTTPTASSSSSSSTSIGNKGGGLEHNNVPPVIILNKIIKI